MASPEEPRPGRRWPLIVLVGVAAVVAVVAILVLLLTYTLTG